jgi:hypothetical protein
MANGARKRQIRVCICAEDASSDEREGVRSLCIIYPGSMVITDRRNAELAAL